MTTIKKGTRIGWNYKNRFWTGRVVRINAKTYGVRGDDGRDWRVDKRAIIEVLPDTEGASMPVSDSLSYRPFGQQEQDSHREKVRAAADKARAACTLEDAPEYIRRQETYLGHAKLTSRGRPRDNERKRSYLAEGRVFETLHSSDMTFEETKECLEMILESEWLRARFGEVRVSILPTWGSGSKCMRTPDQMTIRLAPIHNNLPVSLHELAHALTPTCHPGHGELWRVHYVELVREFMSREVGDRLQREFEYNGLRTRV